MAARPGVVLARLYDDGGRRFAEYRRVPGDEDYPELDVMGEGGIFYGGHLHVWEEVVLDGQPVGTVYLLSTLDESRQRTRQFTLLAVVVLVAAAAVAILVSARLQSLVLRPVGCLVQTAKAVSGGEGYSLRAEKTTTDELGLLVNAFNHMMDSIEDRDAALQAARIQLERRVEQRTADLRLSAERLVIRHEMDLAILSARSPEEVARAVLARISKLVPCREAKVVVVDPATERTRVLAVEPPEPLRVVEGRAAAGSSDELGDLAALRRGELQIRSPEALAGGDGTTAFIDVPMLAQEELIGVLSVGLEDTSQSLPRYGRILTDLAVSLAIAIRQASLFQQTVESAATKARLLEEINHRVKNNLASIVGLIYAELRCGRAASEDSKEVLRALRGRVEGLAAVHSMLSDSGWAPLRLSEVARQVTQSTLRLAPRFTEVKLVVPASTLTVTSKQATSLAIVLNELATNVIKYAAPGRPSIRLSLDTYEDDGWVVLELGDDGPGYPHDVLSGERRGLGLYLVEEMVRSDLGGELELANAGGARVTVRFPCGNGAKTPVDAWESRRVVMT
jgi:two-component sensor histidine kinase